MVEAIFFVVQTPSVPAFLGGRLGGCICTLCCSCTSLAITYTGFCIKEHPFTLSAGSLSMPESPLLVGSLSERLALVGMLFGTLKLLLSHMYG